MKYNRIENLTWALLLKNRKVKLTTEAWVNFKFYGITGALILLSVFQPLYLMRYLSGDNDTNDSKSSY